MTQEAIRNNKHNHHGQGGSYSTPSDNAEKIGIIEGRVGNVEKQVETLPEQMAAMRERLVMVEQRSISTDTKLTMVLSGVWALFIGVFGILVNEILKRVRIGGSKAESGSVPTIGAGSSK